MAAVAKLDPEPKREIDWSKPVPMRWWRLPNGEHVGHGNPIIQFITVRNGNVHPTRLSDGVDIDGVAESIILHPDGKVVVSVRCGAGHESAGHLRTMVFRMDGHGVPL